MGTEFNVVRDSQTNGVIGILVRNPEPFNDPKVPAADIATTIVLSQRNVPSKVFTTLSSKDRSRVFIADMSLNLALQDLDFTFTYLEFDGTAYDAASVVTVTLFASPPSSLPIGNLTSLSTSVVAQ